MAADGRTRRSGVIGGMPYVCSQPDEFATNYPCAILFQLSTGVHSQSAALFRAYWSTNRPILDWSLQSAAGGSARLAITGNWRYVP